MKPKVYVVLGPTATGKTVLSVALAQMVEGEIVSADSMQIYRKMDIGTAKPMMEEREGVAHHMIDIIEPDEPYSVALYQAQAKQKIADILHRGKTPILAGGAGLYVNAITHALDFSRGGGDPALRRELNELPTEELHRMLETLNSGAARRIHPNNKKRVIRAIEIEREGKRDSGYDFEKKNDGYAFHIIGLFCDRPRLYQKIEARVDEMMARGLVEEARRLREVYGEEVSSMQAIGYREFAGYFDGKSTLEETAGAIKQNTRRFAKRQMTWFKRDDRVKWHDVGAYGRARDLAAEILKNG